MDIDADTAISEAGPGQFEVNLLHSADVLKIADDTWLFKQLVRGTARKHGFAASFMAKPYDNWPGTGMHMHFSITDKDGVNLFNDNTPGGSPLLRNAVAGCLQSMPGTTLLLAPHENSYDRFMPGAHAPTGIAWAYENRTAAVRIPSGNLKARRIEHRVAGGDINPYLMMAGGLGAALIGIADQLTPPAPITGNAYELDLPQMPVTWQDAIDAFERSPEMARIFAPQLIENLVQTKRQELRYMAEMSPEEVLDLYIDTV
jgi:glutamine synthetase